MPSPRANTSCTTASSGITPAERLLDLYHGAWQGDVKRIYADFAY